MAAAVGIPAVYDLPEDLFSEARPDFVDIITDASLRGGISGRPSG
jgi:hypothetical protein